MVTELVDIKVVLFDLYGTLAYVDDPISDEYASDFLVSRGYEVYPQALKAAWQYVSFIDYPKYGYKTWRTYLKRVLQRLGIKPDKQILRELSKFYKEAKWGRYPDVEDAVTKAKEAKLKTAIVTTIARFKYKRALKPVLDEIDLLVDGHTFRCEKSNPRIYLKALEALGVKADEAVMIGDDMKLDILVPKKLGMKAILLDRTERYSTENIVEADAVVKNLNEAMDVITRRFC